MKAVIGLGNPGDQYSGTRHNIGFEVVEALAHRWRASLKSWRRIARVHKVPGRDVVLAEPTTFMNASGEAVGRLMAFHKIEPHDVLVVVDEAQLPIGRLRLGRSGSAGGHNGLKSVIEHVGSDFPRLRIGIGRGDPRWDLADHVLSTFRADEREEVARAVERAADAVEMFIDSGIERAMNTFNAKGETGADDQPQTDRRQSKL